jgi:hypothetical protein
LEKSTKHALTYSDIPFLREGVVRWRAEGLTPADVQALCAALENNRTLTWLDLGGTELAESSSNGWIIVVRDHQALCEAVENNRTVTILNLSSTESAESSLNEWSCRYEAISMDS